MLRAAGRVVLAIQRTGHNGATSELFSPSPRLHVTSRPPAQLTRLFSSMPRLRSLDVSAPGGTSFNVDLPTVQILLSSLPPSLEALNLRGWGVVLEPQQLEAAVPEEPLPRDTLAAVAASEAALRIRLKDRTAVIASTLRVFVSLLPLVAARAPGLRRLSWLRLVCGKGLLPHLLLASGTTAVHMRASLHAGVAGMPLLRSLELVNANDDSRVSARARRSQPPWTRCGASPSSAGRASPTRAARCWAAWPACAY